MAGFTQLCGLCALVFEMCWVRALLCSVFEFQGFAYDRNMHVLWQRGTIRRL